MRQSLLVWLMVGGVCLRGQVKGDVPLRAGTAVNDFVDTLLLQERYFSLHLAHGDMLDVKVEAPFSSFNRFRIFLFGGPPNPFVQLDEAWPREDGKGTNVATIDRAIAANGTYYVLIYGDEGATGFKITASVVSQPTLRAPPDNCLIGSVDEVQLGADGDVVEAVIDGTKVGTGTAISLPARAQLRAELRAGRAVSACYNPVGQIDSITLRSR